MPAPLPLESQPLRGACDPEAVFAALSEGAAGAFWFDAGPAAREGWSVLGVGAIETDPERVRATMLDSRPGAPASDGIPFLGGWAGWIGYEGGAARAGAPTSTPASDGWISVETAIAIDHRTGAAHALAPAHRIAGFGAEAQRMLGTAPPAEGREDEPAPRAASAGRHTAAEYGLLVERCRETIRAGDAYLLCLTTRFSVAAPDDPFAVYRRLRRTTPSHHGGYVRIGDRHLLSASPEQFLAVGDGTMRTSPIKGTRPRGRTPEEDDAFAEELRDSVKERAENVMIVDLMRNDLSHVGVPGSIVVERLWEVESYPAVHQLVSTVRAVPAPGTTFGDLCDATFPAGSMTGAPKLSAMTILHGLEGAPRGVYSGCFGHVGLDGSADLAMVIRSIVVDGAEAYVGAGGGITWLSDAAEETAEVATKARAPLAALGAALPADWAGVAD